MPAKILVPSWIRRPRAAPAPAGARFPTRVWAAAAIFVVASLDRPPEMRLVLRGVPVEIGTALLWLLAAWMVVAPGARSRVAGAWRVVAAGLPWLVVMLVSGAVHLTALQVVPYALRGWTLVVALFVGWVAFGRAGRRRALETAVAGGVLLQAAVTAGQSLLGMERGNGTFFIATTLGAYMALVLPLAFVLAVSPGPRRGLWWGVAALAAVTLLSTSSRSPLFAAVAGCAVAGAGVWSTAPRRAQRMLAVGSGAALLLVALLATSALMASPGAAGPADSDWRRLDPRVAGAHLLDLRLPIYRLGRDIWRDHPWLGIGGLSRHAAVAADYANDFETRYGARLEGYANERGRLTYLSHVHQQYLQVAVEYGALGLLAWVGLLGWLIVRLGAGARGGRPADAAIGAGVLTVALIHGMLDVVIPVLEIELGLLLGACLGDPRNGSSARRSPDQTGRIGDPQSPLPRDGEQPGDVGTRAW